MINVQFIRKLLTIRDRYSLLYEGSHSENYPKHEPLFRMTSNTSTPAVSKSATARSGVKLVAIAITAMIGAALSVLILAEQGHVSRLTAEGAAPDEARRLLDRGASPDVLLAAADNLVLNDRDTTALARDLIVEALRRQPRQPVAWARLAYYDAAANGQLTSTGIEALETSVSQCGYCDKALLRWRLAFALDHWSEIPEPLRMDIFRGAEFLRWWHIDGAFLAEANQKAQSLDIPFREYQAAVVSDMRPNEVVP